MSDTLYDLRKGIETVNNTVSFFSNHDKTTRGMKNQIIDLALASQDIMRGVYALIERLSWSWDYADEVLEDDETGTGGTSYVGETLNNFLCEIGVWNDLNMHAVNNLLKENGIKPIKIDMAKFTESWEEE
jgi:hypothetical protein